MSTFLISADLDVWLSAAQFRIHEFTHLYLSKMETKWWDYSPIDHTAGKTKQIKQNKSD